MENIVPFYMIAVENMFPKQHFPILPPFPATQILVTT